MILKYLILAALTAIFITASDPYFGTDFSVKKVPSTKQSDVQEVTWKKTDAFLRYLNDFDDRVDDRFTVDPYYMPMVQFWFLIYTQFESNQVVIHDKNNMAIIYKVLDLSSLTQKEVPKNTLYVLQQKLTREKIDKVKQDLAHLVKYPFSLEPKAKTIYRTLQDSGVQVPTQEKERREFFLGLYDNIRSQTGQKNFIREGIIRSMPYQHFLKRYFESRELPRELLAIPFLESSFNPKAHSKVNALGVWQFMPLIASYFVPTRSGSFDYRSNVGVASISAAFLMSENYKIMKRWDLAVTAYNSGTKHLLKTKRELASDNVDLEAIIKHSDSRHFGFASKNFYSEFLALAHTLAYEEELFSGIHKHDRRDVDHDLQFYLTKCSLRLDKSLSTDQFDDVKFHNHHISDFRQTMPRGLILTAKSELPSGKFKKLTPRELQKVKPKDWLRNLNQSCSTR